MGEIHRLARTETGGFLIDLNRSAVAPQLDYFADQPLIAYPHHVVHGDAAHAGRDDQGTRNLQNGAGGFLPRYVLFIQIHGFMTILSHP